MDQKLSDKLKALGVELGAAKIKPKIKKPAVFSIEKVLKGYEDVNSYGTTFYVKDDFPKEYRHGNIGLAYEVKLDTIASWGKLKNTSYPDPKKVVFLDTETSGLAGGTGTYVFLIGLGYFTDTGFQVVQLFLRGLEQELSFLASFNRFFSSFDLVVTYNGKAFDLPLLINRHIMNGFTPPFSQVGHIDFLHLARKIWKNRFQSRRLADLEIALLGMPRKEEEVPGWLIPDIYFNYLQTGDARSLAVVFYHNQMDVVSLAALFNLGATLIESDFDHQAVNSLDAIGIGRFYEDLKNFHKSEQFYELGMNQGLPEQFQVKTLLRRANLFRKQGDWDKSVELWKDAARFPFIEPCIELAKYYEHQKKDFNEALIWTKLALQYDSESYAQLHGTHSNMKNLQKRLDRLQKLSGAERQKKYERSQH
jgi:uncharacterized protein